MCTISKVNLYLSLECSKSRAANYHKVSPQHNINSTLIIAQIKRCHLFDLDISTIETSVSIYLIYYAPVISHLYFSCTHYHIVHKVISSDYFVIESVLFLSFYFRDDLSLPTIPNHHRSFPSFLIYCKFIKQRDLDCVRVASEILIVDKLVTI